MYDGLKHIHDEMSYLAQANGGQAIAFSLKKAYPFKECYFQFGSVTKLFTALAICSLVSKNGIRFDEKISDFFPELTDEPKVTVHDLLHMNPTLPDYINEPQKFYVKESGTYSDADKLYAYLNGILNQNDEERIRELILSLIPCHIRMARMKEEIAYSNTNYYLLGQIIQTVSGENYFDYLSDSGIVLSPVRQEKWDHTWPMAFSYSSCGLRGTFSDVIHLYHQIHDNQWNYRDLLLTDKVNTEEPQYLLGIKKRGDWYFHDGKMPSVRTIIGFNLKKDLCFCALAKEMESHIADECFRIIYKHEGGYL